MKSNFFLSKCSWHFSNWNGNYHSIGNVLCSQREKKKIIQKWLETNYSLNSVKITTYKVRIFKNGRMWGVIMEVMSENWAHIWGIRYRWMEDTNEKQQLGK